MATNHSQVSVKKLYLSVIEDVVANVRDSFLDEGIDEQVLQELKIIWESKLASQKAIDQPLALDGASSNLASDSGKVAGVSGTSTATKQVIRQSQVGPTSATTTNAPVSSQQQQHAQPRMLPQPDPNTMIPIQITIPKGINDPPGAPKTITISVPSSCIQSNKLQEILSKPEVQAFLALPLDQAGQQLQQFVNNFLRINSASESFYGRPHSVISHNGPSGNTNGIVQADGHGDDTTDEDEEELDDDDDLDDDLDLDKEDDKDEEEDVGQDEEPLNSEDDVSDAEDTNDKLYEVDNVVVCQYDKITRTRNKWKFHLKDGIMNLNGKDFVFCKCNGDAEW